MIKFLGTGGAFDFEQGNSSAIITTPRRNILLDCGHSVYPKLRKSGLVEKIDTVILTHLHDDHCGSLSTLIFHYNFISPRQKLTLLLPEKFIPLVRKYLTFSMGRPEDFVDFLSMEQESSYVFPINTFGKHVPEMQTFGYYFEIGKKKFVYSGDIGDMDFLIKKIEENAWEPEVIFCDISFADVSPHIFYKEAEQYLGKYFIIGYHHNPSLKPVDCKVPLISEFPEYLFSIKS